MYSQALREENAAKVAGEATAEQLAVANKKIGIANLFRLLSFRT